MLFLGYHKNTSEFINKYGDAKMNLDEVINTNLPKLLYISIPSNIANKIIYSSSIYTKKILRASPDLDNEFIHLINDRYNNLDYFMVHG
jgi:hypothetical protein